MENKQECDCYYTKFCKSTQLEPNQYCKDFKDDNISKQIKLYSKEDIEKYINSLCEFGQPLRGDNVFSIKRSNGEIKELIRGIYK